MCVDRRWLDVAAPARRTVAGMAAAAQEHESNTNARWRRSRRDASRASDGNAFFSRVRARARRSFVLCLRRRRARIAAQGPRAEQIGIMVVTRRRAMILMTPHTRGHCLVLARSGQRRANGESSAGARWNTKAPYPACRTKGFAPVRPAKRRDPTWKAKRLSHNGDGTRRDPEPGRDKGGTSPPPKPRRAPCGPETNFEYNIHNVYSI